ncbi:class I SAM-dependent methyltransferase [Halorarius halobius]|uniref:class I SAM-dependent methyltransferase n=1 Tax=Halorarius halobius TaxID=2962671 RepID=UPI0020CF0A92|nr:class I SAM-dependent methyltransferase [Halorarius halobius]
MPEFDFDATFDPEVYLHFYADGLAERTDRDIDLVSEALSLSGDEHLLDVPCGHGRVTNRLAEQGHEVTGVDRSAGFLDRARADARERGVDDRVDYRQGDMRELPLPDDSVDAAFNVFTSFGYFDDADNRRVLEEAHRVVRPGGRFLVEMVHQAGVMREFHRTVATHAGPDDRDLLVDENSFDPETGRMHTDRTTYLDGERRESTYSVRLYTPPELRARFEDAGFEVVGVYGDGTEELTMDAGRVTVVGEV